MIVCFPGARPSGMSESHQPTTPPDVSLLLRAHAEQRWLSREVIPVLRQIETRERLPEEQLPAALAYLEVIWSESHRRARQTDMACAQLEEGSPPARGEEPRVNGSPLRDPDLTARARDYHAAVLALRHAVERRLTPLLAAPAAADSHAHARF